MTGGDSTDAAVSRPSRRALLAAIATGAVGGLAGCSLGSDGGSETPPSRTTDATTATGTSPATTPTRTPVPEEPTPTPTQTPTDAPAPTPAAGSLDPAAWGPPDEGDWERTFADFFADGSLDGNAWSVGIEGHHEPPHCVDYGARSFCVARDHVAVDDETDRLRLRASDEPLPETERDPPDADVNYTVGAVNTRGNFAQEFGYFEVAARVPDQPGTLPACWLFLDKFEADWREIGIYEKNGSHGPRTLKMGAWFEQDDGPDPPDQEFDDNDDRIRVGAGDGTDRIRVAAPVDETFHVIGVEWAPDSLAWYVNGDEVGRVTHPGVAEYLAGHELFLIMNNAVFEGADWLGSPADATFPHFHEFEWVRVWQRRDWT